MSDDEYRLVLRSDHTLTEYPCGVRAGDHLRLKQDLPLLDDDGNHTRGNIPAGSVWLVVAGLPHEPDVVWLQEPSGNSHIWDETVLEDFELLDPNAVS